MKKCVLILICCLFQEVYAQMPVNTNNKVEYSGVIEVPGMSKDQVYDKVKSWMATSYKSSKEVIQSESKEEGNIIGKAAFDVTFKGGIQVPSFYTLKFDFKEGKMRYAFSQIYYENQGYHQTAEEMNQKFEKNKYKMTFIDGTNAYFQGLTDNLKTALAKKEEKGDW